MTDKLTETLAELEALLADLREASLERQQIAWGRFDGGQDYSLAASLADRAADAIERTTAERDAAIARVEALEKERDEAHDLTWFWQIVDADGPMAVPSDERNALARLVAKAKQLEQAEAARDEAQARCAATREALDNTHIPSAVFEGTEDLPDDEGVVIKIGDRSSLFCELRHLRAVVAALEGKSK